MSGAAGERAERRVLILAPFGRDAQLLEETLRRDDVATLSCGSLASLAQQAGQGCAVLLLAEEALGRDTGVLAEVIARQPAWSDLPVVLMTQRGSDSPAVAKATETLGNVTLVERPVRVPALRSAVRTALRARERQYQMRTRMREREEADRRKDEFLATLAHELRNPLAPIRNTVNILRLSGPQQPGAELWEMMERQVRHMVRLVDDLLEVSRITRGKIELRRERVELAVVLAAAIETSRPLIEAAGHQLEVSLPGEPLVLDADATRLAQVFGNLLNNAARYTEDGGRIALAAERIAGEALVTVRDTGIGIAAESLPFVFDMFMQANPGPRRSQPGLGIGLTLARALVEMHAGTIGVASEGARRGSVFTVRLPLAAQAPAQAARPAHRAPAATGKGPVLVVDDNKDAADSLASLLAMLGADVRVAHSGAQALDTLQSYRPSVVFLDLGMPEMDGYEVARRIRARGDAGGMRLVALTGWGQERDRKLTKAAGFDEHLIKPADLAALQAVLSPGYFAAKQ